MCEGTLQRTAYDTDGSKQRWDICTEQQAAPPSSTEEVARRAKSEPAWATTGSRGPSWEAEATDECFSWAVAR